MKALARIEEGKPPKWFAIDCNFRFFRNSLLPSLHTPQEMLKLQDEGFQIEGQEWKDIHVVDVELIITNIEEHAD